MPFLMFGFKTYIVTCSNNDTIELINYSYEIPYEIYHRVYCNESLSVTQEYRSKPDWSLPPPPGTHRTTSNSSPMNWSLLFASSAYSN
jgi:hypothetical protein